MTKGRKNATGRTLTALHVGDADGETSPTPVTDTTAAAEGDRGQA
jgi:hypothetical protein